MDFDERLDKAISRGTRRGDAQAREAAAKAISQEELKKLHSQYRLQVSEHIEKCVEKMANHFPGFRLENIYGESGWGAGCSRDRQRRIDPCIVQAVTDARQRRIDPCTHQPSLRAGRPGGPQRRRPRIHRL